LAAAWLPAACGEHGRHGASPTPATETQGEGEDKSVTVKPEGPGDESTQVDQDALSQATSHLTAQQTDFAAIWDAVSAYNKTIAAQPGLKKVAGLKIMTMNVGFLDLPALLDFINVPALLQREEVFERELEALLIRPDAPDVIFFQELWTGVGEAAVGEAAKNFNYVAALYDPNATSYKGQPHGLGMLVKKTVLEPGSYATIAAAALTPLPDIDRERLMGVQRRIMHARVKLASGETVLLATTHFTAGLDQIPVMREQTRQLASFLSESAKSADYAVLGADFNIAADLEEVAAAEAAKWTDNRRLFFDFYNGTRGLRLLDAFKAVNPQEPGLTQDRRRNAITAACFSTKDEPSQRIDFIWIGSAAPERFYRVRQAEMAFTEPVPMPDTDFGSHNSWDKPLFLSDHFAVRATVDLLAAP
jgi:exonuclease III